MKRSSMFLLELLGMILVFSLCATVCMRMIGQSWVISDESKRLTEAVYLAESAAARLQSSSSPQEVLLPEGAASLQQGYNVHVEEIAWEKFLRVERITVTFEDEVIYTLDVTCGEGVS